MARTIKQTKAPESSVITSQESLGEIVRHHRTNQMIRIDVAARQCNVSVQLLSNLETGKRVVRLDKLLAVANALGLELRLEPRSGKADAE